MQARGEKLRPIRDKQATVQGRICCVPQCEKPVHSNDVCASHSPLQTKFNLSVEMIECLFADPKCEICGRTESGVRGFHVDHDHECCGPNSGCDNCVRGLLCAGCNQGLGIFRDSTKNLQAAIAYLDAYRSRRV
jgi:hypothetical protein